MKIVSDGTPEGTHVLDDSGNAIKHVIGVHFLAEPGKPTCAMLKILGVEIEAHVNDEEVVKVINAPEAAHDAEQPSKEA